MIGFLIWNTGNLTYPVVFIYAEGREQAKQETAKYIRENALRTPLHSLGGSMYYNPDNWIVEPVTREQDYPSKCAIIAPKLN